MWHKDIRMGHPNSPVYIYEKFVFTQVLSHEQVRHKVKYQTEYV